MKTQTSLAAALLLSTLNPHLSTAFAQGSLTPPGPPAPTMKTLDQIEPRTPISSLPFTINQPGSYFVTTNLTGAAGQHGVIIQVSDVTLDLNGFRLRGGGGVAGSGIFVSGVRSNLHVYHGVVTGWAADGVNALDSRASQFERLRVSGNSGHGIRAGSFCAVSDCVVIGNTLDGISVVIGSRVSDSIARNNRDGIVAAEESTVRGCVARENTRHGISASHRVADSVARANNQIGIIMGTGGQIIGCSVVLNGTGGIQASSDCLIKESSARSNVGIGIQALDRATLIDCKSGGNLSTGMVAGAQSVIKNCSASLNTYTGIRSGPSSTVLGCSAHENGQRGVHVLSGSLVRDCTARGNGGVGLFAESSTVVDCTAVGNSGAGIEGSGSTTISRCTANANAHGIIAGSGSSVRACTVRANDGAGIRVVTVFSTVLADNNCDNNGVGILVEGGGSRIEGNHLYNNTTNLWVQIGGNFIVRNTSAGAPVSFYSIAAGNIHGPIVNVGAGGDLSGVANGNHPWANFRY